MVHAYTAIIIGEGAADGAVAAIRDLPGVTEAYVVSGDFDVIAETRARASGTSSR
jgi:DNA-binding Lrp family transcriptional regulator